MNEEEIRQIEAEGSSIDFGAIWNAVKKYKRLYCKVLSVTFVVSCIYVLSLPNYYTCEVKLAPELSAARGSSLTAMATTLRMRMGMGAMGNTEALYPMLYPELMEGTDFKISLFDVLVHKKDSTRMIRYYDYLLKEQKSPWWSPVINAPFRLIGALFGSKEVKKEQPFDAFQLTKTENQIVKSLDSRVFCEVDNKTFIITINVVDQDPFIAACMADTIKHRLQDFITEYRTKKARVDLEHTRKLHSEAKERYEKARRLYAEYADANQDIIYQTARIKLTELENDMQLKYNIFVSLSTQLQGAEAMVQEETPAFTTLQSATVPVQKSAPRRTRMCLIYLFLAFLGTTAWVLYKENLLKSLFGFN